MGVYMIIVKAKRWHLEAAANDLSKGDLEEFHSHIPNRNPRDVIPECLDETTHAIVLGALVLAVGGSHGGCIWFVTTNVVDMLTKGERIRFYKILKKHYGSLKGTQNFEYTNFVSVDNHSHIRLLNSLGASFAREHVMSPAGCRFRQFWL
jgi:hypothetical protein